MMLVDGNNGDTFLSLAVAAECPDQNPELQPWNPGHDPDRRVHIGQGRTLLLASSATVHSINISAGGKPGLPPQSLSRMEAAVSSEGANVACFGPESESLGFCDNHQL